MSQQSDLPACDHREYRHTIEGYVCGSCKAPAPFVRPVKADAIGDCWKVTIEQWRLGLPGTTPEEMPDAIAYAVGPTAEDAALIVGEAYTTKSGPMTRVKAVEYVGNAWKDGNAR